MFTTIEFDRRKGSATVLKVSNEHGTAMVTVHPDLSIRVQPGSSLTKRTALKAVVQFVANQWSAVVSHSSMADQAA